MEARHPKSVRRRILTILYELFMRDPLEMATQEDILADGTVPRDGLAANVHYLGDRGLVELMLGYDQPIFSAARITVDGVDLVENRFEFNLRFPPVPGEEEEAMAELPVLVERLVEEVDFSPLDGEARRCLLRDVQYLRDEVARPVARWRREVVEAVLGWMAANFESPGEVLPSLERIRQLVAQGGHEESRD